MSDRRRGSADVDRALTIDRRHCFRQRFATDICTTGSIETRVVFDLESAASDDAQSRRDRTEDPVDTVVSRST